MAAPAPIYINVAATSVTTWKGKSNFYKTGAEVIGVHFYAFVYKAIVPFCPHVWTP